MRELPEKENSTQMSVRGARKRTKAASAATADSLIQGFGGHTENAASVSYHFSC